MEPHDLERIRRSVAMLPPGHSAGALTKEIAEELLEEVRRLDGATERYREVIRQLRLLLSGLEEDDGRQVTE